MGGVVSYTRGLLTYTRAYMRDYNIQARAIKFTDKQPKPAPKHETTEKLLKHLPPPDAEEVRQLSDKNMSLHERLKQVYVESEDVVGPRVGGRRPLPESRVVPEEREYGYLEPEQVTPGHVTYRQALEIIERFTTNTNQSSPRALAEEYQVEEEEVVNVLRYFSLLQVTVSKAEMAKPIHKRRHNPLVMTGPLLSQLTKDGKGWFLEDHFPEEMEEVRQMRNRRAKMKESIDSGGEVKREGNETTNSGGEVKKEGNESRGIDSTDSGGEVKKEGNESRGIDSTDSGGEVKKEGNESRGIDSTDSGREVKKERNESRGIDSIDSGGEVKREGNESR